MPLHNFEKTAVVALLILNGSNAGSRYPLPDVPTVLGRSAEAHYRLDDPWISNMLALFEARGEVTWVVDLDSRNGTFVGAARVHEAPLAIGDVLSFGRTEVKVEAASAQADAAPTHSPPPFLIDSIRTTVRAERPETPLQLTPRPLAVLRLSLSPFPGQAEPPLGQALEAAVQAIVREDGRTTPHLAANLLAVFGLGGAHPDDAVRALRAAAAIRRRLAQAFPTLGMRLAVDFGQTVAGIITRPDGAELVAGGETPDRLERVLDDAATGEVLVGPGVPSDVTARLESVSSRGSGLPLRRLRGG
jgi:hypothetical protein